MLIYWLRKDDMFIIILDSCLLRELYNYRFAVCLFNLVARLEMERNA